MKFFIKDFSSKCDQIRMKLWIWSHLLKKYLMENFIFCTVKHFIKKTAFSFIDHQNWLLLVIILQIKVSSSLGIIHLACTQKFSKF